MTLQQKIADLYRYLAKHLNIAAPPKIILTKDEQNAKEAFGKTAYYDHANKLIRVYITNRHDTDILRSFSHEVIHHWQNENGTLHSSGKHGNGEHYAQNDPHLRKMEMQAYLLGNLLMRDFQDENRYGPPTKEPMLPWLTINDKSVIKKNKNGRV